ncbi:hypothetical protein [Nitrobacter vulgaris]|uniref:Uncharacterized protein n=1 Tax=Nitrobacter vulgaris TaxID=29421 RepID=A0A1V4HWU4_NITVU|nr:hypothetical protein [Nitrobacter vulgaris]OPH82438.1 hypothetical protein B2M20_11605 [Nitrobacter vulgaris]
MSEFALAMDRTRRDKIEADLMEFVLGMYRRYHNAKHEVESALMFAANEIASREGITAGHAQDHYQLEASRTTLAKRKMYDGAWLPPGGKVEEAIKGWPHKESACQEDLEKEVVRHCRRYDGKQPNRFIARALTNVLIAVADNYMLEHLAFMAQSVLGFADRTLPGVLDEALGQDRYPA